MEKLDILRRYFGHEAFRPGQEKLVDALLAGRDALGVMPTGAGKSMCYQVPALMLPGQALVISPLISLMKDQVAALIAAGVPAAYLNSSLSPRQFELAMDRARAGAYRVIYVAPERLEVPSFLAFARQADIRLLAVDEAHCVSQWGQDFRPNYLRIADFIAALPRRPAVGAFTATATERVRQDIVRLLGLRDPVSVTTGFDRPNLFFEVLTPKKRFDTMVEIIRRQQGRSGIVYCASRKNVETVAEKLQQLGISAARYHAGLSDEERRQRQEDFQYDRAQVMVATNAFGMGIDKSNVGFVIHYNMPRSIEAYYQEAGRAGRDGEPAECVLLYSRQDIITARWMIDHGEPNPDLTEAERARVRRQDLDRLNRMVDYCESRRCLRGELLRYFGQEAPETCGGCSNCQGGHYAWAAAATDEGRRRRRAAPDLTELGSFHMDDDGETASPIPAVQDGYTWGAAPELLPMKKGYRLGHENPPDPEREALLARLRACRLDLSRQAHVPPYIIFDDKTLNHLADVKPTSQQQLLTVRGMGSIKAAKYGPALLAAIRGDTPAVPPADKGAAAPPAGGQGRERQSPQNARGEKAPRQERRQQLRRGWLAGVSARQLAAIFACGEEEVRRELVDMRLLPGASTPEDAAPEPPEDAPAAPTSRAGTAPAPESPWSPADDERLRRAFLSGASTAELAELLSRDRAQVMKRLRALGMMI